MTKPRPHRVVDLVRAAAPRGEPLTWPPRHALEDNLPVVAAAPAPWPARSMSPGTASPALARLLART
ncbi:hypothetical protein [Nannocystis pusilla]|uniref:hypothetical protein n=1 Tax=Nannocystis pusilla TaxID=889268 RepID=UPI003B820A6A